MFILLMAQLPVMELKDVDCSKNPVVQAEATHCAWQDYKVADAEMNARWATTMALARDKDVARSELPKVLRDNRPTYSAVLKKSQRAWLAFRDAQCASEGYFGRGGTIEPMLVNLCLARITRERTAQLRVLWKR